MNCIMLNHVSFGINACRQKNQDHPPTRSTIRPTSPKSKNGKRRNRGDETLAEIGRAQLCRQPGDDFETHGLKLSLCLRAGSNQTDKPHINY